MTVRLGASTYWAKAAINCSSSVEARRSKPIITSVRTGARRCPGVRMHISTPTVPASSVMHTVRCSISTRAIASSDRPWARPSSPCPWPWPMTARSLLWCRAKARIQGHEIYGATTSGYRPGCHPVPCHIFCLAQQMIEHEVGRTRAKIRSAISPTVPCIRPSVLPEFDSPRRVGPATPPVPSALGRICPCTCTFLPGAC